MPAPYGRVSLSLVRHPGWVTCGGVCIGPFGVHVGYRQYVSGPFPPFLINLHRKKQQKTNKQKTKQKTKKRIASHSRLRGASALAALYEPRKKTYGNPLGRGERWARCGVNALALSLSLSLSLLSLARSLSLSLSCTATLTKGRKIGAF